jgi:hypothetical protein
LTKVAVSGDPNPEPPESTGELGLAESGLVYGVVSALNRIPSA